MTREEELPPRTESLVRAFQGGAEPSFALLYERLAPALYAWAILRAPRSLEPGDLLGEGWLRAVRGVQGIDAGRASFRARLFGIAKRVLLHELRGRGLREAFSRRAGEMDGDVRLDLESVPDSVTSLSQRFERDESMIHFLERIDGLGREDRDLVVYCGLEGFSCGEAATRMGLSEEATTKRWQRLRAELRNSSWAQGLLE